MAFLEIPSLAPIIDSNENVLLGIANPMSFIFTKIFRFFSLILLFC